MDENTALNLDTKVEPTVAQKLDKSESPFTLEKVLRSRLFWIVGVPLFAYFGIAFLILITGRGDLDTVQMLVIGIPMFPAYFFLAFCAIFFKNYRGYDLLIAHKILYVFVVLAYIFVIIKAKSLDWIILRRISLLLLSIILLNMISCTFYPGMG